MTGEVAIKEVYATSVSETDEFYHIHVNGEEIVATGTHPFYVYKFGWTTARALRAGDVLVLLNGELVTVEWIDHEILESPIKVYNFEVEDFHTYFVGESSVLVHNDCVVGKYGDLQHDGNPGQAHHVGQNAAFGDVIPRKEGISIKLNGDIFTQPNSPHYKAHKTLEEFWNDYREGGKYYGSKPTIKQYNKAAYKSLINAGISQDDAVSVIKQLFEQQTEYGFFRNSRVPRIPGKIGIIK